MLGVRIGKTTYVMALRSHSLQSHFTSHGLLTHAGRTPLPQVGLLRLLLGDTLVHDLGVLTLCMWSAKVLRIDETG